MVSHNSIKLSPLVKIICAKVCLPFMFSIAFVPSLSLASCEVLNTFLKVFICPIIAQYYTDVID